MLWGMEKYHRLTKIYWNVCRPLDSFVIAPRSCNDGCLPNYRFEMLKLLDWVAPSKLGNVPSIDTLGIRYSIDQSWCRIWLIWTFHGRTCHGTEFTFREYYTICGVAFQHPKHWRPISHSPHTPEPRILVVANRSPRNCTTMLLVQKLTPIWLEHVTRSQRMLCWDGMIGPHMLSRNVCTTTLRQNCTSKTIGWNHVPFPKF